MSRAHPPHRHMLLLWLCGSHVLAHVRLCVISGYMLSAKPIELFLISYCEHETARMFEFLCSSRSCSSLGTDCLMGRWGVQWNAQGKLELSVWICLQAPKPLCRCNYIFIPHIIYSCWGKLWRAYASLNFYWSRKWVNISNWASN